MRSFLLTTRQTVQATLTDARRRLSTLLHDIVTLGAVLPPRRHEAEVISLAAHRKLKKDAQAA